MTTSQARDRVLEVREGDPESTQSLVISSVHGRKVQTYVRVREKLRSQPGRKDHQAHRNSKGSEQARKTGPPPDAPGSGCRDYKSVQSTESCK